MLYFSARGAVTSPDWGEYGTHTTASGPPRFMHIGLAVTNLDDIIRRLDTKGIDYWAVDGPIGRQLYQLPALKDARLL